MALSAAQHPAESDGWKILRENCLLSTPHLSVAEKGIASPLRPEGRPWLVVHRKPAVVIIPRLPDGRFVMIRQERPPVQKLLLEFPAGQVDEAATAEILEETARRELHEETGLHAIGPLRLLGRFYSSPGFTDEMQTIFLASVEFPAESEPVIPHAHTEAIAGKEFLGFDEIKKAIAAGEICDANSHAAFAKLCASEMCGIQKFNL